MLSFSLSYSKDIPFEVTAGCAVKIDPQTIMLLGGRQGTQTSKATWIWKNDLDQWNKGPDMILEREEFGCGFLSKFNLVVAIGGMSNTYNTGMQETEVLYDDIFHQSTKCLFLCDSLLKLCIFTGTDMPMNLRELSVVENPHEDNSLFAIGGFDDGNKHPSSSILKLTCYSTENCSWTILTQKLKVARYRHVSAWVYGNFTCYYPARINSEL